MIPWASTYQKLGREKAQYRNIPRRYKR
jgi:hypothetical protein